MVTRVTLGSPLLSKSILSGNVLMLELDASGEAVAAALRMTPACNTNCKAVVSNVSVQNPDGTVCKVCSEECNEAAQAEVKQ